MTGPVIVVCALPDSKRAPSELLFRRQQKAEERAGNVR